MLVELGGGTNPHPRASIVIDLHHPKGAPASDATKTPWLVYGPSGLEAIPSDSVDEVYSSHFMEHIHRGQPLLNVMNEAWRILKPGGTLTMVVPLVGYTLNDGSGHLVNSWQPYADPTHVNFWWFPEALLYFCDGPFKPNADYGIKVWSYLGTYREYTDIDQEGSWWSIRYGWEGIAKLVKP